MDINMVIDPSNKDEKEKQGEIQIHLPQQNEPEQANIQEVNNHGVPGPPPLADLLDIGIEDEIRKEDEERLNGKSARFPLSPSQFGGCARALAISLAEFTGLGFYPNIPLDARAKRRFTRGYDIEYSLGKQFKKYIPIAQGFEQQYIEMAVTPDGRYIIGGSLDKLFMSENHMIVDIKSKATYYSSYMSDSFEETFDDIRRMPGVKEFGERAFFIENIEEFYDKFPKDDFISRYFLQLNAYSASDWANKFRSNLFPGIIGVNLCALAFENKNNHIMAELRWKPSRNLYDYAIKRMQDIYQWVVIDKKDPASYRPDYTLGSIACRLCSRKEVCWADTRHPYKGPKKKWAKDTHKLPNFSQVEKEYEAYKKVLPTINEFDILENRLIQEIYNSGHDKVKFSDGCVYEIKELKSPQRHLVLRRSK